MSPTGMDCQVKLEYKYMDIGDCSAEMKDCDTYFDPEVQIEHNQQSVRFTCTNDDCSAVSPATCDPETTTTTVVTSTPYCETTRTTTPSPVTGNSPTMCTPHHWEVMNMKLWMN